MAAASPLSDTDLFQPGPHAARFPRRCQPQVSVAALAAAEDVVAVAVAFSAAVAVASSTAAVVADLAAADRVGDNKRLLAIDGCQPGHHRARLASSEQNLQAVWARRVLKRLPRSGIRQNSLSVGMTQEF